MKHSQPPEEDLADRPTIANEDAERVALGACFYNPKHADAVSDRLSSVDFSTERHKVIFDCIKHLRSLRVAVDTVMVAEQLLSKGQLEVVGLSYLTDLYNERAALVSVDDYIRILKEKTALRRIASIGNDVVQQAYSGADSKELIKQFESQLYVAAPHAVQGRVTRLGDDIESNYIEWIDPRGHAKGAPITTGFQRLDELTGGVFPEEIWMWAASTGVGKTGVLLQIANHCLTLDPPIPFLIFSIEMSKQALYRRLACQRAMVSVKRFRTGDLSDKERAKISDATAEIMELPLYIDASAHLTVGDIRLRTQRAFDENGIKMCGIDFIQKVRPVKQRMSIREGLNEVSDEMIEIAKDFVPFHVLSQLNNDHRKMKGKPTLGSLKESSNLAEIAHVTVSPYRPAMEPNSKTAGNAHDAEFLVLKNREGELGTIPMSYIGWRMLYLDREEERTGQQEDEKEDF